MTHTEQIKKRIKYLKMSIVHDEYGEVRWLCDSLTLAVDALEKAEAHIRIGRSIEDDGEGCKSVNVNKARLVIQEALAKISHGHLESRAGGEGKA